MPTKTAVLYKKQSKIAALALLISIILQLSLLLFHMSNKLAYGQDEVLSYGLANSTKGSYLYPQPWESKANDVPFKGWIPGTTFAEYLTVQEGEQFAYKHVWQNQEADTHPPLYYLILHTICSFFPETFSKWQGFLINIVCFVLTQILLFLIGKKTLNSDLQALLLCAFYGFGMSAINNFICIRMYALFTVIALGFLLAVLKLADKQASENKCLFAISLLIFLGCMTQYHFYVYAFFVILVKFLIMLYDKQYKSAGKVAAAALIPVILAIAIYPAIITHMQTSPRAIEAFGGVKHEDALLKFCWVFSYAMNYILGINFQSAQEALTYLYAAIKTFKEFFFPVTSIFILLCCLKNFREKISARVKDFIDSHQIYLRELCIVFTPAILFCIIIPGTIRRSFFTLYARFFFFLMPIFCLALFLVFRFFLGKFSSKEIFINTALLIVISISCLYSHFNDLKNFTLPLPKPLSMEHYSELVNNQSVFWIYSFPQYIHQIAPLFKESKRVYPTTVKNFDTVLKSELKTTSPMTEKHLLFLPVPLRKNKEVKNIIKSHGRDIKYIGTCFVCYSYNIYEII
ncbi:MAG: glycosyltransferase family 39 protein [Candidatus Riflebacteria bacterium]|nr:glycosyltransferase family 39 protein [Candidatus Riflebacteria bacterium]